MSLHPTITAALADQHRRDLMSQASAYRLARTARQGSSSRIPARRSLIVMTLRTAAAASAIAATAFVVTPAGPAAAATNHARWAASVNWVHSWGTPSVHWRIRTLSTSNQAVGHHF